RKITNQRQLDQSCADLTNVIQIAIHDKVPIPTITAKTKRWWTKELILLRRNAEKLGRQSYKCRSDPTHKVHMEHKDAVKQYEKPLQYTKKRHCRDWLEKAEEPDIWTARKLVSAPNTDGGIHGEYERREKQGDRQVLLSSPTARRGSVK
ncbi:hypothetical protein BC827DRAFT_914506, partial [Russula dissimulans]